MIFYDPKLNTRNIAIAFAKICLFLGTYFGVRLSPNLDGMPVTRFGGKSYTFDEMILAVVIVLVTVQTTQILRNLIWDYYLPKRKKIKLSSLLVSIINFLIYVSCAYVIFSAIFGLDMDKAFAATGAVGVVLGFGLQRMIMDVFIGVSIDMDKSFQMGDWVHIRHNGLDLVGAIIQMNWRVVSVQATENKIYHIPNNVFSSTIVTNLSHPTVDAEFENTFTIPYKYNEKRVMDIITFALDAVSANGKIWDYKCRLDKTTLEGVQYKIKYWLRPDQIAPGKARHLINSYIFRFLRSENISFSTRAEFNDAMIARLTNGADAQTVMHNAILKDDQTNMVQALGRIDIFASLTSQDLETIATQITVKTFNKDDIICAQGDEGQSLFIVKEGYLRIKIRFDNGEEKQVAVLIPEDFFGEMSMLTGAPRSATVVAASKLVVYEVPAQALLPIFEHNDKFHTLIARTIAERESVNAKLSEAKEEQQKKVSRIKELEEKILNFAKKLLGFKKENK